MGMEVYKKCILGVCGGLGVGCGGCGGRGGGKGDVMGDVCNLIWGTFLFECVHIFVFMRIIEDMIDLKKK